MTEQERRKLRGHYNALVGQSRVLENFARQSQYMIEGTAVQPLARQLTQIEKEFPELAPDFNLEEFLQNRQMGESYYKLPGIQAVAAIAIGQIKAALEEVEETPVTEQRSFDYVADAALRSILQSDYSEIQRAFIAGCSKAVVVLAGGAIEAILTDLLLQHKARAADASAAPANSDIERWGLSDLIEVAVELGLVSAGVDKLSHSIREYRNLAHPGNQLRTGLSVDKEEAKIAIEVLHIVDRDLR